MRNSKPTVAAKTSPPKLVRRTKPGVRAAKKLLDDELPETEPIGKDEPKSASGPEVDIECHLCNKALRISSAEQTETVLAHFIVHYAEEYGIERFSCCHCNQTSARREGVWREVVSVYLLVVLPGYPAKDN
ncbi:hypothetical protein WR25_22025 [Diploscapter pachys]|uniref:Uncharacterized protein n=1 Tax=Diploscapter pachys TaxID=2018661 RepID=A0A2A2JRC9_9BILA|nr:hypothetical protein WR25_22025 [Diploscapter pachys]